MSNPDAVLGIAVSPDFARDLTIYLARTSGVFRSVNAGNTWHAVLTGGSTSIAPTCVTLGPGHGPARRVWVGARGGMLHSSPHGEEWERTSLGFPPPLVSTIVAAPHREAGDVMLAGTFEDGIFRSGDGGLTWQPANVGVLDGCVLAFAFAPGFPGDGEVYAGTATGILRSDNGGKSWQDCTPGDADLAVTSIAVSPMAPDSPCILAGTETHGLLRSTDRGHSWSAVAGGDPNAGVHVCVGETSPGVHTLMFVSAGTLGVSQDNGETWQVRSLGKTQPVTALASVPPNDLGAVLALGLADGKVMLV